MPPRRTEGLPAVDPEADEEGEMEDVGNSPKKTSVIDSLDIRVARGKDDSASDEERDSSDEDQPERFRPNLAKEIRTRAKRAEARGAKSASLGGGTTKKKGKKAASASITDSDSNDSNESDPKDSSQSDAKSESGYATTSEEETANEPAGSGSDSSSYKHGRNTRGRVGRPLKQANNTKGHQQSAFAAGIERGKKKEASLVAPIQRAIVGANLSKRAKLADDRSVKGKAGKKGADKTGSTAKAGGLRDNMYE